MSALVSRLVEHLTALYPNHESPETLAEEALRAIGIDTLPAHTEAVRPTWSERDVAVITYGDTILDGRSATSEPLAALRSFIDERLGTFISMVHVLPFFPYSSDDGFSVVDFAAVREDLGQWSDIANLGRDRRLMADLIVNHASASSQWFQQFMADEPPGKEYFVTADPTADLSDVVRPRTSPLLCPVDTPSGTRHVWATFSHDQLDLDFANPEVLLEFLRLIDLYVTNGVRALRLDAVGYLWKEIGTTSIHHPQTHRVVKVFRELLEVRQPDALLITETNVPHAENVSYFGDEETGNEAHLVYNFTMPPLVLQAMLSGSSRYLKSWIDGLEPLRPGTSFFNFLASHDGIGVRPTEGILSPAEVDELAAAVKRAGGRVSMFTGPDGTDQPYELNVSLFAALRLDGGGVDDGLQIDRFCAAHAIMLAFVGVPAFYIHSLLASPNDLDGVAASGANRSINRAQLSREAIDAALDTPSSPQAEVLRRLGELAKLRRSSPAFHPEAAQALLETSDQVVGLRRTNIGRAEGHETPEVIDVYVNVSASEAVVPIDGPWEHLDSDDADAVQAADLVLAPYGSGWIRRR